MEQKAVRAAVAKALRARRARLRKGHWQIGDGDVVWYVDLRADSPRPDAALTFEVGAWVPALGLPGPDGGAVDCPLLLDVPLDSSGDVGAATGELVDRLAALGTLTALCAAWRAGDLSGALVDRDLRALLDE
jgi:hypothetical protein